MTLNIIYTIGVLVIALLGVGGVYAGGYNKGFYDGAEAKEKGDDYDL